MTRENTAVRTAQDLERKYDLSSIGEIKKNIELNSLNLTKVENENTNILKAIIINLDGIIEDQSDISLWFFNGVPTLENEPYIDWATYDDHIGDIYYDKDTGKVYVFKSENDAYIWQENTSSELMRAMALTNAEVKIGNERKVFLTIPTTPYQNGDWYIDEKKDLYICQVTRDENEKYHENDFIIATKYTDDSYAIGVGENLTILSGTVTEIKNDVDSLNTTMTNTTELVNEQEEKIGDLQIQQSSVTQTVNDFDISIKNVQKTLETANGTIETLEGTIKDMSYNFSTEGMKVGTSTDPNNSLFNNTGIKVYNYDKLNAIFNNKGSGIDKLIVTGTAQIGYLKFVKSTKNNKKVTKIYHLNNLVEDLEDLEV